MSCKSALYTALQTPTAVAVDGVIPLGSIIRRYGCDANLNGNAVNITNAGYYDVDVSVTVAPTAAGTVTATLVKDGVAIPCAAGSALTLVLTGAAATVNNVALRVQRI